ncbi:hypothetical protein C7405_10640 [Paraburkholderia caballeronis]|nr:hypothetical protein C7405_10640 [Paraburkholderia caballeronis]
MGRDEKIEVLESKVEMYAGNYLEVTHKQGDLESQVKELQQKLDSQQEAQVQAQRSRDEEMVRLFNDVLLKLGWPQNFNPERPDDKALREIITDTWELLEGDASESGKAAKALKTLNLIACAHGLDAKAYGLMANDWMTKDIDNASAKMSVIKKYPKALEHIEGWMRMCWPMVQCHVNNLWDLRVQMERAKDLAILTAVSAFEALRQGSSAKVTHTCFIAMYRAWAAMTELNDTACQVSVALDADLARTTSAVEAVLELNGKANASLGLNESASDDTKGLRPRVYAAHELPQDFESAAAVQLDSSSTSFGDQGGGDYGTYFEEAAYPSVNPSTGLPMISGTPIDTGGHVFGTDF